MRDFLRDIKAIIEDLPVTVTSRGQPIFTVVEFDLDKYYEEKGIARPIVDKDAVPTSASHQPEVSDNHGLDKKQGETDSRKFSTEDYVRSVLDAGKRVD